MKLSNFFTGEVAPGKLFRIPDQPSNIMLDLTSKCNHRCLYCYNPDFLRAMPKEPDVSVLKGIINLIGRTGTEEILYLGGEPFALPQINEILKTGQQFQIFQRAVSNGSFFHSTAQCSTFKAAGLDEIGISFHSSIPDIHDKITGVKNSHNKAMKGVSNCLAAGIPTFIQYSPNTLNPPNDLHILAEDIRKKWDLT